MPWWFYWTMGVIWNGNLALIPVVAASLIGKHARSPEPKPLVLGLLGLVWLAFLPNTCYLLTEWRHFLQLFAHDVQVQYVAHQRWLGMNRPELFLPLLCQSLFFFSQSGLGVVTFTLAIRPVVGVLPTRIPRWAALGVLFLLSSVGVCLGLLWRVNSWDLLQSPGRVLFYASRIIEKPELMGVILFFAVFLGLCYWALDVWFDGLALRLGKTPKDAPPA